MADLIITPSLGKIDFIHQSAQAPRFESIILHEEDGLVFTGKISASSVTAPLNVINVTAGSSNVNYPLIFASSGETGAKNLLMDSAGGTYNPSINTATIDISGNSATTTLASNSTQLNGQAASYYTNIPARLGYTPVNKIGDTISGDLVVNGNFSVNGSFTAFSASNIYLSSSVLTIEDNILTLNAFSPYLRYAGIEMYDSGSGTLSSMLWDGQGDYFFLSGSSVNGKILTGPDNQANLSSNFVPKATAGYKLGNSLIYDNGTNVGIGITTPVYKTEIYSGVKTSAFTGLSISNFNNYDGTANSLVKSQLRFAILENPITTYDASQRTFAILESGNEANNSSSDGFFAISTRLNGAVAEKFRITSAGNVGIGTTDPATRLDVVGLNGSFPTSSGATQATGSILRLRNGNSNLVLDIGGHGGNGNWIQSTNRSDLSLNYSLLLNPNGGNVGIGTTGPVSKLHIEQIQNAESLITLRNDRQDLANVPIFGISAQNNTTDVAKISFYRGSGGNSGYLTFSTKLDNAASLTEKVRIDGGGNVGIGTATFSYASSNRGNVEIYGSTDALLGLRNSTANSYIQKSGNDFYLNNGGAGTIYFQNNGSNRAVIDSNGYVGIATTSILTTGGNAQLTISTNSTAVALSFGASNNDMSYIRRLAAGAYQWQTYNSGNTGQIQLQPYGGSVGIGTTSPSSTLHVNSTTAGATLIRADGTNGTLFSVVDDLSDSLMSVNNSAGLPVLEVFADDRIVAGQYGQNDLVVINNKVGIGTNNPIGKLYVTSSTSIASALFLGGNVGIGTTNPVGKLDVRAGSGGEIVFGTYDANYVVKIQSGDQLNFYNGASPNPGYINYGGGATVLSQNLHVEKATAGVNGLVRIKADGNVGIGTTLPFAKLHVQGNISASSFTSSISNAVGFLGTSSWANNASSTISSSYALNATSASYALLASTVTTNANLTGDVTSTGNATTIASNAITTVKILDANVTNAKLANSSVTIGSTAISLGTTATTIAGLTSVTSTTFVGNLTGTSTTASYANNLNPVNQYTVGGITGSLFGTSSWATNALTANNVNNATLTVAAGTGISLSATPTFTANASVDKTITVTNSSPNATHTGDVTGATALTIANDAVTTVKILNANVTNAKLANSSVTIGSTAISLGGTTTTLPGLTSITSTTVNATTVNTTNISASATGSFGIVGIATTSPAAKLHVVGKGLIVQGITGTPRWDNNSFEIQSTGGNGVALEFHRSGNTSATIASMAGELSFYTDSGTERMRISATSGNFGIGTTSPAAKLDVVSSPTAIGTIIRVRDTVTLGTGSFAGIHFTSSPGTDYTIGKLTTAAGAGLLQIRDQSGNQFVTVDSGGNVGIGISNPSTKLDVVGAVTMPVIRQSTTLYAGTDITDDNSTRTVYFNIPEGGNSPTRYFKVARIKITGNYQNVSLNGYFTAVSSGNHVGFERKVEFDFIAYAATNPGAPTVTYLKRGPDTTNVLVYAVPNGGGAGTTYYDVYIRSAWYNDTNGELAIRAGYSSAVTVWQSGLDSGTSAPVDTLVNPNSNYSFDTSGNVGIGTTSPFSKLHIYSATSVDTLLESGTSGTSGKLIFKTSDNADLSKYIMQDSYYVLFNGHSNEGFKFRDSSNTVLMTVYGTTNSSYANRVGIGTTAPATTLHVVGVISGSSFSGAGTGLTGTAAGLSIGGNAATATTAANVNNGTLTISTGTGIGIGATTTFTANQSGNSTITLSNTGVTSNVAGTGISVSGATGAVTITNSGVTSAVAGTGVGVSAATGAVTFSIGQAVGTGNTPTFAGATLNGQLNVNHSVSTAIVRLWNAGSTVWSLGVGDTAGSYFNISADFGSILINKTNGNIWISGSGINNTVLHSGTTSAPNLSIGGNAATATTATNANAISFTEVELNAPVTVSGTWTSGNGSEWGEPKFGTSFNQFRYADGNGPYVEYNIPANHHSCFISQLQWDTGGYADCHGVQADGDLVFLRRINTRQLVENSNHGNTIQHDGATVTFAGSGLQAFTKIRITNRLGRIHMTGIAFTRQIDDGYEGTGMVHPAQISHQGAGSGLDADLLDGYSSATANTANTIVLRDASGNFSAGTITATLNGNVSGTAGGETLGTVTGRGGSTGTQILVATAAGQAMFVGRQAGAGYSYGSGGIFTAQSDNPNGTQNAFFQGYVSSSATVASGNLTFSIRADGQIYTTMNTATGIANNSFSVGKTITGTIHIANGSGTSGNNRQAAITFQGGSSSEAQAGIYVSNNNSSGTAMGFATTDSYTTGPQLFMTATNTGVVNFSRARPTYAGNALVDVAGGQTIAGITYFSNGESMNVYGIRGRFTNEYLHLYNKVGIGHPGGWGQGEGSTPNQGLSTYGGITIAYGTNATSIFYGNVGIGTTVVNARVESYYASNAITFNYLATNLNVNSPIPVYGFDVTSGAETRSIKAGIGYERHLPNGRGTLHFYNDSTNDTQSLAGNRTTAGDIKMSLDNSGNLGIGTTQPSWLLTVYAASAPQFTLQNGTRSFILTNNAGDNLLSFNYGGVNRLQFDTTNQWFNTGNLGVGNTSPQYKLHVTQATPSGQRAAPANTSIQVDSNTNNYISLVNTADNGTYAGLTFVDNNIGGYIVFRNYTGDVTTGSDSLIYGTFQDHIFQNSSSETINGKTETMRIKQNGNVGIGSNNPQSKLDVNGVLAFGGVAVLNTANNGNDIYANVRVIRNTSSTSADGMYINYDSAGTTAAHLRFYANAGNERMRIQANDGNVGIGTTSAGRRLDVEGIVRTRGASGSGGFEIGAATTGAAKWRIEWDSASDSLDFNWVG